MRAIFNAIRYGYHAIGEIVYQPFQFINMLLFALESLAIAGGTIGLVGLLLTTFGTSFEGLFLIGMVIALFLLAFFFLRNLLKARVIARNQANLTMQHQEKRFPALLAVASSYTFGRVSTPSLRKGDAQLLLPLMVTHHESFSKALQSLQLLRASQAPRVNPDLAAVKTLGDWFSIIAIVIGIVFGAWLGFSAAGWIVVSMTRRLQAAALALAVFLAVSWLPVALSAAINGLYQSDLLLAETAEQAKNIPASLKRLIR